jgi:hypothetical protein
MKAQDIIDLLPIVADRGWHVKAGVAIRDREGRCPICALAHELSHGQSNWYTFAHEAMGAIGLGHEAQDATAIVMNAADSQQGGYRLALLRALNLATGAAMKEQQT